MEKYQEFIFAKLSSGNFNDSQVDYLMTCMESNGNMDECLGDLNLLDEYHNFLSRKVTDQQTIDYQKTLLADKINTCQEEIAKHSSELAPLSTKLSLLLNSSTILDARYKNFPDNPTYVAEKGKILKSMSEIQVLMNPLEEQVEKLRSELESLQLAID